MLKNSDEFVEKGGAAWLSPAGDFYLIAPYSHIASFSILPLAAKDLEFICQLIDDTEMTRRCCEERCDEGEHPAWHTYEIEEDNNRGQIINLLYTRGFVRVVKMHGKCYFEGNSSSLKNMAQTIQIFAEKFEVETVFSPRHENKGS